MMIIAKNNCKDQTEILELEGMRFYINEAHGNTKNAIKERKHQMAFWWLEQLGLIIGGLRLRLAEHDPAAMAAFH